MKEDEKRKKEAEWIKNETTQYLLRFSNKTGIPEAIKKATEETEETAVNYIKFAVVQRLQKEGFIGKVVINLNKQRHKEKLERLEKYIKEEKQKLNK